MLVAKRKRCGLGKDLLGREDDAVLGLHLTGRSRNNLLHRRCLSMSSLIWMRYNILNPPMASGVTKVAGLSTIVSAKAPNLRHVDVNLACLIPTAKSSSLLPQARLSESWLGFVLNKSKTRGNIQVRKWDKTTIRPATGDRGV